MGTDTTNNMSIRCRCCGFSFEMRHPARAASCLCPACGERIERQGAERGRHDDGPGPVRRRSFRLAAAFRNLFPSFRTTGSGTGANHSSRWEILFLAVCLQVGILVLTPFYIYYAMKDKETPGPVGGSVVSVAEPGIDSVKAPEAVPDPGRDPVAHQEIETAEAKRKEEEEKVRRAEEEELARKLAERKRREEAEARRRAEEREKKEEEDRIAAEVKRMEEEARRRIEQQEKKEREQAETPEESPKPEPERETGPIDKLFLEPDPFSAVAPENPRPLAPRPAREVPIPEPPAPEFSVPEIVQPKESPGPAPDENPVERKEKLLSQYEMQLSRAKSKLMESYGMIAIDPERALIDAIQAVSLYKELGQSIPSIAYWIVSQAYASLSWGEMLVDGSPPIENLAVSSDSRWLLTRSDDSTVLVWDIFRTQKTLEGFKIESGPAPFVKILFTSDFRLAIGGTSDGTIRIWNTSVKNPADSVLTLAQAVRGLRDLQVSPDGRWLVAYGGTGIGPSTRQIMEQEMPGPDFAVPPPEPRLLASERTDSRSGLANGLRLPALLPGRIQRNMLRRDGSSSIRLLPDTNVATGSGTKEKDRVSLANFPFLKSPMPPKIVFPQRTETSGPIRNERSVPDRATPVVTGPAPVPEKRLAREPGRIVLVNYNERNKEHEDAVGSHEDSNAVWLWDLNLLQNGIVPQPILLRGHERPIHVVQISADSKWLVTGSDDATARVYNLKGTYPGADQAVLKGHQLGISALAIAPNGDWVATGSRDNTIRLWSMPGTSAGPISGVLNGHLGWVSDLVIDETGRRLVSGSYDKTIRIWKIPDGRIDAAFDQEPHVIQNDQGAIRQLLLSRDGRILVSLGGDSSLRIRGLDKEIDPRHSVMIRNRMLPITKIAFSPDNRWLIFDYVNQRELANSGVRLWPIRMEDLLESAAEFCN